MNDYSQAQGKQIAGTLQAGISGNGVSISQQVGYFAPMIESLHDFNNRFSKVADAIIGPRPEDAQTGRGQPPTVAGAPVVLLLQRTKEDFEYALNRLADTLLRLEGRI